jgi:hypothetical protein
MSSRRAHMLCFPLCGHAKIGYSIIHQGSPKKNYSSRFCQFGYEVGLYDFFLCASKTERAQIFSSHPEEFDNVIPSHRTFVSS